MTTDEAHASPPEGNEPVSPEPPTDVQVVAVEVIAAGPTPEQADQIAGAVGRNWGVLLGFGIILAGLGTAVMVWPQATIGVIAILLGVALLIGGLFSLIAAVTRSDHPTSLRVLSGVSGVLSIVLGGFALSGITKAVTILALMIGFGWIVRGIGDLVLGFGAKGARGRGLTIAAGAIGVAAGIVLLVWPSITLLALAYVSGILLILLGILQIVMAIRVRSVTTAADLEALLTA